MDVTAEKELSVAQVAARTSNRKGGVGVGMQYIRDEIKLYKDTNGQKGLKARLVEPLAGRTFYVIEEQDFLDWEAKRGRPPQENEP